MADRIVTIAASGGDYTTFALALAGESDFQAGEDNIVFRRTDNVRETSGFTVSGFTTTSAHWVILECNVNVQHDGTRASGAGIVANSAWSDMITISIPYVKFHRLEICNSGVWGNALRLNGNNYNVIDSCLIYDSHIAIHCGDSGYNRIVVNSFIYNCAETGIRKGTIWSYHNTILNCDTYGQEFSDTSYLKNTYSGGNATADYYNNGGSVNVITSASSDGTLSTSTISIANCEFTVSTAGSENANISGTSDLIGAGTSLSSDSVYPVTVDCFGNTRASTPCIGAVEYVSSGSSSLPAIINHYKNMGVM